VLHLSLALYMVSFSLGIAVLFLSLFAHATYHERSFLRLAAVFGSVVILLIADALMTYNQVVDGELAVVERWLAPALWAVGSGLFAYALTGIVLTVTSVPVSPIQMLMRVLSIAAMAAVGALRPWFKRSGFPELPAMTFGLVQVYAIVVLLRGLRRIETMPLRVFFRQLAKLVIVMLGLGLVQLALRRTVSLPAFFREFPLVEILSFFGIIALLIFYAVRYFMKSPPVPGCVLSEEFVRDYGISPRECEIASMMIQGLSNGMIGEKLFISAATVKNHIYHIYKKTGVTNKVQLINILNPPK
jgi:DNA-binding CsgD family transcriptional regulator